MSVTVKDRAAASRRAQAAMTALHNSPTVSVQTLGKAREYLNQTHWQGDHAALWRAVLAIEAMSDNERNAA